MLNKPKARRTSFFGGQNTRPTSQHNSVPTEMFQKLKGITGFDSFALIIRQLMVILEDMHKWHVLNNPSRLKYSIVDAWERVKSPSVPIRKVNVVNAVVNDLLGFLKEVVSTRSTVSQYYCTDVNITRNFSHVINEITKDRIQSRNAHLRARMCSLQVRITKVGTSQVQCQQKTSERTNIDTPQKWIEKAMRITSCKTIRDKCNVVCPVCQHNFRGKSVQFNSYLSHLRVKHGFTKTKINSSFSGEEYQPRVAVQQQQPKQPTLKTMTLRVHKCS